MEGHRGSRSARAAASLVARFVACFVGTLVLGEGRARAFTISTALTRGCHEVMTTAALRTVRAQLATAAPLPASRNERALIADLQFTPAPDMTDLGGATLLIGVRDNDLQGLDSNDLRHLALLHGNPLLQREHCLHGAHDAEPGGSQAAILDCRAFIDDEVDAALDGLDANGAPDPTVRASVSIYLALRHNVDAPLPAYYVHIGRAIHALEDSVSHGYHTPDDAHLTAVMNWVDQVQHDLNEAVDGPPHTAELDRCDDPDAFRTSRRLLATQAATSMLMLTLDPTQSRAQKTAAVGAFLDGFLSYSPGCTAAGDWCDAPERAYPVTNVSGCDVGATEHARWGSVVALALLALVTRGRRRRWRRTLAIAAALLVAFAGAARAETAPPPGADAAAAAHVPPPRTTPVPEPGPPDRSKLSLGAYLGASGSATDEAAAVTLGARLRVSLHWTFGLDGEWNPFIAVNGSSRLRPGVANLYGTAIFRIPLAYERVNLRITGSFGASRMLMDLYGVDEDGIGIYAAVSPLGVEWKASRLFYVILNPLSFAAPVPQVTSIPYWYPQYRVSVGLEVYAD